MKTSLALLFALFFLLSQAQYQHEWVRGIVSKEYCLLDQAAILADGGIIVAGRFNDRVSFKTTTDSIHLTFSGTANQASYVAKINSGGNFEWAFKLGSGATRVYFSSMKVTHDNDILFSGWYEGSAVDLDPGSGQHIIQDNSIHAQSFLVRYSSSGQFKWAQKLYLGSDAFAPKISEAQDGSILLHGRIKQIFDADPGSNVHQLDPQGNEYAHYVVLLDSAGGFKNGWKTEPGEFKLSSSGKIFSFGHFSGIIDLDLRPNYYNLLTSGASSFAKYIACNNPDGSLIWAKRLDSTTGGQIENFIIEPDESVLFGGFQQTNFFPGYGSTNMTFGKFDHNGKVSTLTVLEGGRKTEIFDLDTGLANNVFCLGNFKDSLKLGAAFGIIKEKKVVTIR